MLLSNIRIAIVDDHALFRKTLKNYLSEQKNITIVIQASDTDELICKLRGNPVDILLMDVFMPGLHGKDAVSTLLNEYPSLKILVVSMSTDLSLISELLDTGIHGYISKAEEPEELLQAIRSVYADRLYQNRLFTEALYWSKEAHIKVRNGDNPVSLSEREKKILRYIWEERSNKEIAAELFLSIRSVEKIRQDIKEKIGAKSTVGLLKYGIHKKIITIHTHEPKQSYEVSR